MICCLENEFQVVFCEGVQIINVTVVSFNIILNNSFKSDFFLFIYATDNQQLLWHLIIPAVSHCCTQAAECWETVSVFKDS